MKRLLHAVICNFVEVLLGVFRALCAEVRFSKVYVAAVRLVYSDLRPLDRALPTAALLRVPCSASNP